MLFVASLLRLLVYHFCPFVLLRSNRIQITFVKLSHTPMYHLHIHSAPRIWYKRIGSVCPLMCVCVFMLCVWGGGCVVDCGRKRAPACGCS